MKRFIHHIRKLLQFSLLLYVLTGISNYGYGQAANDYRTVATGNWNNIAVWQRYDGTAWVAAAAAPTSGTANVITIRNGHTITVTASVSVDQTIIDAGGQITVNATITLTIANGADAVDMTVAGTLVNSGTITTTGTLIFNSGSTYQHARDAGTIPTATWNAASTCLITGVTSSTLPGGFSQNFGNLTWNCPGQGTFGNSLANSNYTITGTLTIINTGSATVQLVRGSYTGNVVNFVQTGGTAVIGSSGTSLKTLNVSGSFTLSGGTFNIDNGTGTNASILNLGGNFTQSGGTFTRTNGSAALSQVYFNGTAIQTFTISSGTISGNIDYTINSGSTVDFGTTVLSGSGLFTLSSGGSIITAHTQGLSTTAATGSIQVTDTKSYNTGASYTYNGTSAQVTGNGLTGANTLTINNSAGVTLTSSVTLSGTLYLTSGIVTTGANTLTVTSNSSAAVTGGSATSFVDGPLTWQLATGSTYNFPVGAGTTYLPFGITGITGTAPRLRLQAYAANTGGSSTVPLISLSTTEYWQASVVSGTYSGGSVSLTRQIAINEMDAIGRNTTTLNGAYSTLGGTVSGTSLINSSNTGASLGYFVMATMKSITTGAISGSPFCAGTGVSVPFSITGIFYTGNVFTAQLSDASGNFGSPVAIGTLASTTASAPISATIPSGTSTGTGYRIRVVSDTPILAGTNNGSDLTIYGSHVWTGTVSNDWNTTGNWICGSLPGMTNSVQIPDVANEPVLSSGATGTVDNITIDNNSSLIVNGNTLQISGAITNNGTFTASSGTIAMNGTAAQVIGSDVFSGNTIKDLTINNAAGVTLQDTLNVTGIVTVTNGDLASGGNLVLLSTAAQTALVDGSGSGNITGNVTMQRYLPSGFGYKYFSSPFQASTVSEFGDDMDLGAAFPAFYRYDESRTAAGWVRYDTAARILNPMHGYAVNFGSDPAADTVDVTGVVSNGSLSRTLYNNNNTYTKGFNLVGNPYPSPINWNAASGWTKTNIDNALYYFKASATDQYGGTYSTYIAGVSSDGLATNIIPSMQGVFVHVSDGSYPVTGTLAMNNSVRVTDLTHSFIKSEGSNPGPLLRLAASFADDPSSKDPVVVYFDEKALNSFDGQLDALKLMNTDMKVPNLYAVSSDGRKLSISALPFSSDSLIVVPLGLKINKTGSVIFSIRDIEGVFSEMGISLSDKVTGIDQDLFPYKEYSIYLVAGEYQNRFFLNLLNTSTGISEIINDTDLFRIYSYNGILKAEINGPPGENGILRLFNLTGQLIFIKNIYAPGYYEFYPVINEGIYIASYISGTKRSTKKIFIQDR